MRPTVALALLLTTPALAESKGAVRLWFGSGYDSNAKRDFVKSAEPEGVSAEPDLVFSAIGAADGRYQGEQTQATGSYDLGLRKFVRLPSEDVVIQSASIDGAVALGPVVGLGVAGRGKDRRGGDRDYTDLLGEGFLDYLPDGAVDFRLRAGGHRFLYWDRIAYAFAAFEGGFQARYRFDKRHSAAVFGELGLRRYQADANPNPELEEPSPARPRQDQVISGGAGYTYRGPFTFSATYSYAEQASNSFGETTLRHRLTLTAGLRLPWRVTLLAQAALQYARFPDGVYLSDELNITEDDDTHNSGSLKLVRPVSEQVDLELRCALYQDRLPQNGYQYFRQLGWIGVSWRL